MQKEFLAKLFLMVSILTALIGISQSVVAEWSVEHTVSEKSFFGIWGSSGNDVYVLGDGKRLNGKTPYYNGIEWSSTCPSATTATDVWGTSSTDIFFVHLGGTILNHYDGSGWSTMIAPLEEFPDDCTTMALRRGVIWGSSSSDVYTLGYHCGRKDGRSFVPVYHYDGDAYSLMDSGLERGELKAIWGSSATDVFAVGDCDTILHYDGNTWSEMINCNTTSFGDHAHNLLAIWGSSATDVFAVGYIHRGKTFDDIILHYDGNTWSNVHSGTQYGLNSIWGSASDDVFVVGSQESSSSWRPPYYTILHYDGISWSVIESGEGKYLRDVWGSSSTDVYAVGSNYTSEGDFLGGVILHYDGPLPTTTTTSYNPTTTTTTSPSTSTIASSQPCTSELIYGEHSEEAELLRYFRDNVLSQTPEGQEIIRQYYQWSPVIVRAIEEDEEFKEEVKEIIDEVLTLIE